MTAHSDTAIAGKASLGCGHPSRPWGQGVCLLEVQPRAPLSLSLPVPSLKGWPGAGSPQGPLSLPPCDDTDKRRLLLSVHVWMNEQKEPEGPTPQGPHWEFRSFELRGLGGKERLFHPFS